MKPETIITIIEDKNTETALRELAEELAEAAGKAFLDTSGDFDALWAMVHIPDSVFDVKELAKYKTVVDQDLQRIGSLCTLEAIIVQEPEDDFLALLHGFISINCCMALVGVRF